LITVLTGSLVEDGGYNISQAGSKPQLMKPVNYDQEFEEIFESSPHVKVNLDESKNMGNYPEVVSSLVKLSSGKAQSELENYEKEVDKYQEAADEELHRVQLAKEQVKEDLKELRREQILIEATQAEARGNWELHIAMAVQQLKKKNF
jgi:DNA repair exonuclease SbcCD ATPase subunit